jgi:Spy/CpxP family protein refolding chaperone
VSKDANAIMVAVVVGLLACFGCSDSEQTAENTPPAGADSSKEQKRNPSPRAWWTSPEITAEMNLTEEQAEQIAAIMAEAGGQAAQRYELERRATTRFHRALSQEELNPEQVEQTSAELEEILSVRNRIRIHRIRQMREVLSQEQWEKLWQLSPRALQVGNVNIFRGPKVYVTDGTPVPDAGAIDPEEQEL